MSSNVSRRIFLQAAAAVGGGLIIGCEVTPPVTPVKKTGETPPADKTAEKPAGPPPSTFTANAWVRVAPDGQVTVILDKSEMGQGVETSLAMLVAEELEVDVSKVRVEMAPVDPVYKNALFGFQATGGSTSVRAGWKPLRMAGAAARMMLIGAAARTWKVEESSCRAENGAVIHDASKRRLGYGELVAEAAKSDVPKDPPLKSASSFKVVGKPRARLDGADKARGKTQFGIDVQLPDMLTAVIVRCPVIGGKPAKFDDTKARAVKGVKKVVKVSSGVAVIADTYWTARQAAKDLDVTWDEGPNAKKSSESIEKDAIALAKKPGKEAKKVGDVDKALKGAAKKIDAVYTAPYQAHAAMEPLSCTAKVTKEACEIWVAHQGPEFVQGVAMGMTKLPPTAVKVNITYLGGGFGRRFEMDFVIEALEVAMAMDGVPVKTVWSREDDTQHDFYRPGSYNVLRGGIDKDGSLVAMSCRIVSPSIMTRVFPKWVKDGLDNSALEGLSDHAYAVPNLLVDYHMHDTGIPVGFWRSVGHSQNAFIRESFLDELAALGKQDPVELRRKLLAGAPRWKAVLDLAASKADWGKPMEKGMARGVAVAESFGSFVAQVAEVSVDKDDKIRVHRVVCAIDCGSVVNPDSVEAQMQSGIVYGLTAAMKSAITFENGRAKQTNLHNFRLLRMDEMPKVEVYIVPSTEAPGGCGEPGTPPIAPAVANAVFTLTGKRLRSLPLNLKKA